MSRFGFARSSMAVDCARNKTASLRGGQAPHNNTNTSKTQQKGRQPRLDNADCDGGHCSAPRNKTKQHTTQIAGNKRGGAHNPATTPKAKPNATQHKAKRNTKRHNKASESQRHSRLSPLFLHTHTHAVSLSLSLPLSLSLCTACWLYWQAAPARLASLSS